MPGAALSPALLELAPALLFLRFTRLPFCCLGFVFCCLLYSLSQGCGVSRGRVPSRLVGQDAVPCWMPHCPGSAGGSAPCELQRGVAKLRDPSCIPAGLALEPLNGKKFSSFAS